jgi:hypothetical protein
MPARSLGTRCVRRGARFGADLDDVVGGADHGLVVLDHDHRVAGVGQRADDADQTVDVARVQADAEGSSRTKSVSTSEVPRQEVRLTRWTSPPESVLEVRSSVR